MAGIYKSAVRVAPKTPILIAQASGLKKILANIKGTNPPYIDTFYNLCNFKNSKRLHYFFFILWIKTKIK